MGDLDLDHQVGSDTFDEGLDGRLPAITGRVISVRALTDVERAVRLHPGAGRVTLPSKPETAELLHRPGEGATGGIHDVVEYRGEIFMGMRRRHQSDEPAHRVEADPSEVAVPVDGGKLGDGCGVRA